MQMKRSHLRVRSRRVLNIGASVPVIWVYNLPSVDMFTNLETL